MLPSKLFSNENALHCVALRVRNPSDMASPSDSDNLVPLRVRIAASTYDSLARIVVKYGLSKGPMVIEDRPCRVNLGPLLDMIAAKIEEIVAMFPPEVRKKADRRWRLSADQIRLIRVSGDKQDALAAEYRVDKATISRIKTGQAYRWVE